MVSEIRSATDRIYLTNLENKNFEKVKKNVRRDYHFTNVYHKSQPYDV